MKSIKMFYLLLLTSLAFHGRAEQPTDDVKAISAVIFNYFDGVRDGDIKKLKKAFYHQNMNMKALLTIEGKQQLLSLADNEAFADLSKRPDASYQGQILSINIYHPNAAFVTFDFNSLFIDGFQLLKQDGQWRILNKTFVEK